MKYFVSILVALIALFVFSAKGKPDNKSEFEGEGMTLGAIKRELKRRRRKKPVLETSDSGVLKETDSDDAGDDICEKIFNKPIIDQLSPCEDESGLISPLTTAATLSVCGAKDVDDCQSTFGCVWRQLGNQGERCHLDPCMYLNNGRCTIQHTGGRCVWYTKSQNKARAGINHSGCYSSPCMNVQSRKECRKAGDDFYKCVWCGKGPDGTTWGCQNAELTSQAQCMNLGTSNDLRPEYRNHDCRKCISKVGKGCSKKCENKCCLSPFCATKNSDGGCVLNTDFRDPGGYALLINEGDEPNDDA